MRSLGLIIVLLAGCGSDGHLLSVDLRTDLVPVAEFDGVRAELVRVDAPERVLFSNEALATPDRDYLSGVRIAEADGLAPGLHLLRVQLLRGGARVAERTARFELDHDLGITLLITRDCRTVTCPGPMDPIAATTCAGGRCVDPACIDPEDPACSEPPECASATDCPTEAPCAESRCVSGACAYAPVPDACVAGEWCDPEAGCRSLPSGPDGGLTDGGGTDGGGTDSGGPGDAGRDGGIDAGPPDAGPGDAGPPPTTNVRLAAGNNHACVIETGGSVYCWGANNYGELGVAGGARLTAVQVPGISGATDIAAGFGHTCVVAGALVQCWGRNATGQLGDGSTTMRSSPGGVSLPESASRVATGAEHSCALLTGGAVRCWGANGEGRLGTGDTSPRLSPAAVSGAADYVDVAVGDFHSCGVTRTGGVRCWGSNGRSQLGRGVTGGAETTPGAVTGITDAVTIESDYRVTCVLRSTGAVACWGEGWNGQLGNGVLMADGATPADVMGVSDAIAIGVGAFHECAVRRSGGAVCWGYDMFGQLGDRGTTDSPVPVTAGGVDSLVGIGAGAGHFTCAARAAARDEILCWGRNDEGQLGDGTMVNRNTPAPVMGLP